MEVLNTKMKSGIATQKNFRIIQGIAAGRKEKKRFSVF